MTIYIDGLLFLNFYIDFLLLLTSSVVLKRNVKIFRIVLAAFIGSLTILALFLKFTFLQLFFIKIYLSLIMCIVCFGYKSLKFFLINVSCFYIISILLGGFLYFINDSLSYENNGIVFLNNGFSLNVLFLIIASPVVLFIYIKQMRIFKRKINFTFKTNIYIGKKVLNLNGYLDSGNVLTYKNKPVILTNIDNTFKNKKIYIPYVVIGGSGLLECIKVRKVEVIGIGMFENIYLGFCKDFKLFEADVLLNGMMKGDMK